MAASDLLRTPEWRIEGEEKVTGAARYTADFSRTGMLHAAWVLSPYAHARIVSVDTSAAKAMPGVHAVLTGEDVRPARFGRRLQDWPVLCWDRVRFIGDHVAAVAADTLLQAEEAARAVVVEYEELPAVFDPEEALRPDAPTLHPDVSIYTLMPGPGGLNPEPARAEARPPAIHPNVHGRILHEHGDLDAGFASAARIFEHSFDIARIHQGYIEPHACLVWIEGETVHVITTNKSPFQLRGQMATSLGLAPERIVIEPPHIGGDFGGKGLSLDDCGLYFLARATGRPVRSVLRYADELQRSNTRHSARIHVRTGVDAEGHFLAHDARIVFDGGAYAAGNPGTSLVPGEVETLAGYKVPAARVDALDVYTNTLPAGNARSPGQPQAVFAGESHIDLIARELGVDPLELRERNLARRGDIDLLGEPWHGPEMEPMLRKLRTASRWGEPLPVGRGRGVAVGFRPIRRRGSMSLKVTLAQDGFVEILTGVTDQGTGAHTVIQRIVANELGCPVERVRVRQGSTATALPDPGVGGSIVTIVQGSAAQDGARQLKRIVSERAAGLSLDDAARKLGPLEVTGTGSPKGEDCSTYAYAIEVEVDRETGAFHIVDATLVADVGTILNPVALRGQLEGAFIYGLGQTIMEEVLLEDGRVITANLGDYKLPTIADAPALRIVMHSDNPGPGPFGARSVGELVNPGIGPAVANAVHDAVGARVFSMPITSEKVFDAIQKAKEGSAHG